MVPEDEVPLELPLVPPLVLFVSVLLEVPELLPLGVVALPWLELGVLRFVFDMLLPFVEVVLLLVPELVPV